MWDGFKKHWAKVLTFFATVTIPLLAWVGGFIPDFVSAQDIEMYEQRIFELDSKQTSLAIEFKRSEREDVEKDRLDIEREIFIIENQDQRVPPYFIEQRLRYDQKIKRLEQDIEDLRKYKLNTNNSNSLRVK